MKIFISSAIAAAAIATAPVKAEIPASVAALLDRSVHPCDNFYQYACGGWLKANALGPTDVSKDYSFSAITDQNEVVIQNIVQEDWPLIGEFWDSCMDTKSLETQGAKPLQSYLNKITAASSKVELLRIAGELSRTGAKFVTDFDVAGDYKDAKTNILYLGDAALTLPDTSYYYNDEAFASIEKEYRTYISTIMKLSGFKVTASQQGGQQNSGAVDTKFFEDAVINVEKKIAMMLEDVAEQTGEDAYYNPAKLGEMMTKYPLSIGAYLTGAGIYEKSSLTKDSKVIMNYFDYFEIAEKTLASIDIKDLKTFIAFQYVNNRVRYLSDAFYDAYFQFFSKKLNGQQVRSTRESVCVYRVKQFFPDLVGKYYFMKMFDQERNDNTQLMTKLIEQAMGEHIQKLDWLDNATRIEAAGKLAKVANLIGQSTVKQSYPFFLKRDEFFNNIQTSLDNDFTNKMKKVGNPVNRELWSMSPAEVNAYYSPLENKMVFPAAILQPPFFNGTAHPAQNFGSIGAVIGHELTHGFDSSGRRFDGDGNKRNWWTDSTGKAFDTRATCMKNQYSSFVVTGENGQPLIKVNGERTIGENIADNGGFSLSWDAYHKYAAAPGFDNQGLTPNEADRLLFLSFAQTWCGRTRDGAMVQQITTDPHSPGQWRANGVAMNNENFATTFKCTDKSKMNPADKCKLW